MINNFDIGFFPIFSGVRYDFPIFYDDEKDHVNATCGLASLQGPHGRFLVFDSHRDSQRCANNKCEWFAKNDGMYLLVQSEQVLQFKWA